METGIRVIEELVEWAIVLGGAVIVAGVVVNLLRRIEKKWRGE